MTGYVLPPASGLSDFTTKNVCQIGSGWQCVMLMALFTCSAQCTEMVCLSSGNCCQYKSKLFPLGSFLVPCNAGTNSGSAVSNCEMASERNQSKHSFSIWRGIGFFACSKSTLSFAIFKTSFHFPKSAVHVLPFLWRLLTCWSCCTRATSFSGSVFAF